jgi:hypothetical protein
MHYNGNKAMQGYISIMGERVHINQTAQITDRSDFYVELTLRIKEPGAGKVEFRPELIHLPVSGYRK